MNGKVLLTLRKLILITAIAFLSLNAQGKNSQEPEVIQNLNSHTVDDTAILRWNIDYEILKEDKVDSLIIKFKRSIDAKYDRGQWKYTKAFSSNITSYKIGGLDLNESYVFQIGFTLKERKESLLKLAKDDQLEWSSKTEAETPMPWGILKTLILIGALGFFIFGMKIMSEGIQKAAGNKLRQILGAMTSNRFKGVFTGFVTTSLVQSSSATTVMVVSFVNAGLLTLMQAVGVIMGANIGTTLTAWLISVFGFKVDIAAFALPLIAIGIPLMFTNKNRLKSWGEVLIGFAILFMGLEFLKESVPDLKNNPEALEFIKHISGSGLHHLLLAILIGTIVTIVVQSSSAAMAITIILCNEGYIPFEMACGMVLGENIGTTITANMAAIVANVHAKRAARAHFIFNTFGVIWMIFAFDLFIYGIDTYMSNSGEGSPLSVQEARPVALSIFHTSFNIINLLMMVWFIPFIVKIVIKMVPSKGGIDQEFHLDYIQSGLMSTPELSILEAKKEIAKFGKITSRMSRFTQEIMVEIDKKKKEKLYERIQKYEEITDRVEVEVGRYLEKVSEGDMSNATSLQVRSMLSIINDLERIGDIFYQMSKVLERKEEEKIWFTPEQRNNLKSMFKLIDESFEIMVENLNSEYEKVNLETANQKENEINEYRNELRKNHLENIEKGEYPIKSGMVYNDLFSLCEKAGDHIINVSEAVTGKL